MRTSLRAAAAAVITIAAAVLVGLVPVGPSTAANNAAYVQRQLSAPLDAAPTAAAGGLVVIAHNAGDAASTITQAVTHHARVVEIDTVRSGSQLRARHDATPRSANDVVNLSRTVGAAWTSSGTPGILLDLKTSGAATSTLVSALVAGHPDTKVFVSTPNQQTLDTLAATSPQTVRLLSIPSSDKLAALLGHPIDPSVQGVSIAAQLLDATTVRALHGDRLLVQAWTVNTMARVNALAAIGVDGITTDSLTILAALQHNQV